MKRKELERLAKEGIPANQMMGVKELDTVNYPS